MSRAASASTSAAGSGGLFRFGLGPAIIAAAAWVIFWNEGGAAKTQAGLAEGAAAVVTSTAEKVDPANEGKLIHIVGRVTSDEKLTDPQLQVSAQAIRLKRQVEMYQWRETANRMDGPAKADNQPSEPTYTYEHTQVWNSDPIDSSLFKKPDGHANPPALLVKPDAWAAEHVMLGAFELTNDQKVWLSAATPLPLTGEQGSVELAAGQGQVYRGDDYLLIRPDPKMLGKSMNELQFIAATTPPSALPADVIEKPKVGDIRVKYVTAEPRDVTAMGKQTGKQLVPWQTKAGRKLPNFTAGHQTPEKLFESAAAWSSNGTWFFRAVALVMIYAGVFLTLAPLTMYAASFRWAQPFVAAGAFYVRAGLTLAIGAVLVGVAWLYYRPALAISLFVIAGVLFIGTLWLIARLSRRQSA